jgi:cell wall-associated NlpC family hydrolase
VAAVFSLFAHVYREPDVTKRAPMLTVPFETRLEIAGESEREGRWHQARLADGRLGWVQTGDLTFDTAPLSTAEMLALSRRFLGLPYTWGGTSSFGYDCSGFVQMLERRHGVMLPRDAQPQAEWSGVEPVTRAELKPGDLLYFGASPHKITHTGMYLGDGQFISATTYQTPMVRIDKLEDPHWARLLVAIRRVK